MCLALTILGFSHAFSKGKVWTAYSCSNMPSHPNSFNYAHVHGRGGSSQFNFLIESASPGHTRSCPSSYKSRAQGINGEHYSNSSFSFLSWYKQDGEQRGFFRRSRQSYHAIGFQGSRDFSQRIILFRDCH